MTSGAKRRVYPQFVAIELILVAGFGIAAYLLAEHLGRGSGVPVFLAGVALDRVLILVLRHRNKPLLPKVTVQRTSARKPAGRRS